MSIAFQATNGNPSAFSIKDGFCNPNNTTFSIIESSLPSFRTFNTNSLIPAGSCTILANPIGVSMITNASAIICSTSLTTIDLVELSSFYRQNYAGGLTAPSTKNAGGQYIAGDPTTGIAYYVSSTNSTLVKMTSSFVVSQVVPPNMNNQLYLTVIAKSSGRWLVATERGMIQEIDANTNIIDSYDLTLNVRTVGRANPGGGAYFTRVLNMAYDNNLLTLSTDSGLYVIDWSTKVILKSHQVLDQGNIPAYIICNAVSGVVLSGLVNTGSNNPTICELDVTINPLKINDQIYNDTSTSTAIVGLNPSNTNGFWASINGHIRTFTVSPRLSTVRTITVQSASIGGTDLSGRLLLIDDTSGVGTSKVILDTYMQSPATYRVPTAATIIEAIKVGTGSTATWDVTRYST